MRTWAYCLPLAGLLAGCGAGDGTDPSTASCVIVTATGGCSAAPTGPNTAVSNAPTLFTERTTTTYPARGGSIQVLESIASNGVRSEEVKGALAAIDQRPLAVTYDPSNASFRVEIRQAAIGIDNTFDDPLYRTAFGGARGPQAGTPNLPGYEYLQKGPVPSAPNDVFTFFYETPGTRTKFVTLAGFIRNSREVPGSPSIPTQGNYVRERTVFALGTLTPAAAVPTTGSATYAGGLLATAIYNTDIDVQANIRSRVDWINGTASVRANFAQNRLDVTLTGAFVPLADAFEGAGAYNASNAGRSFNATGSATLTAARTGFTGTFTSVSVGGANLPLATATLNGNFFGPRADEVGGGFRILGAGADQRVEITGAFTGAR